MRRKMISVNNLTGANAFCYTRVSTEEQAQGGVSLETQKENIINFAARSGINILGWYEDAGISGKTVKDRPALMQLISDCMDGKKRVDCVIVNTTDRLARKLGPFFSEADKVFEALGIRTLSASEPNDDTNLIRNINLVFAEAENERKAAIVSNNMATAVRSGWWVASPPLGYKIEKVFTGEKLRGRARSRSQLVPDSANNISDNIAYLFSRFAEGGITVAELANEAKKLGIKTRRGKDLDGKSLTMLLKNPVYAGHLIGDGKRIQVLEKGEDIKLRGQSIIDYDLFNQVQAMLNAGKRNPYQPSPDELYPLKGSLRCYECGHYMTASAPTNGSGKSSPRYHCKCKGHKSINVAEAHAFFTDCLHDITPKARTLTLYKEIIRKKLLKYATNAKVELDKARKLEQQISDERTKILNMLVKGDISPAEKDILLADNKKRQEAALLSRIQCEKALEQNQQSIEQIFSIIANPAELWNNADANGKRKIQQTIFPDGFCINTESKKCGTDKISPLYSVISNKKEHNGSNSSNMVCPIRFERTTFSSAS